MDHVPGCANAIGKHPDRGAGISSAAHPVAALCDVRHEVVHHVPGLELLLRHERRPCVLEREVVQHRTVFIASFADYMSDANAPNGPGDAPVGLPLAPLLVGQLALAPAS